MSKKPDYKSLIKTVFDDKQKQLLIAENVWKSIETNKNPIPVAAVAIIVGQLYSEIRRLNDLLGMLIQVTYTQNEDIQLFREVLLHINTVIPVIFKELNKLGASKNVMGQLKQFDSRIKKVEKEYSKRKKILDSLDSVIKKKAKEQAESKATPVPNLNYIT